MDKLILIKENLAGPHPGQPLLHDRYRLRHRLVSRLLVAQTGKVFLVFFNSDDDDDVKDGEGDDGVDRLVSRILLAQPGLRHGRHGPALLHQCQRVSSQLNGGWIFF